MNKHWHDCCWFLLALLFANSAFSYPNEASPTPAEKTCQMAANPDECLRKLNNPSGTPAQFNLADYPLTSDLLGLSGPLSFVLRYDEDLALVLGVNYVQMFNEKMGVSSKFVLGKNERRANLTAGFAISPQQQVKLTYEYLAQNQNFDFTSGAVQEWVDQHAIGGAYQYLLRHEILHSLEISASTVHAGSKDLSSIAFNQIGNSYDVNYRRIAGGTENTMQAAVNLLPLKNTALTVGAGYSTIQYDTQYEASPSNSVLAYKLEFTHVLTPKLKFGGSVNATASGREHTVGVSHILPKNIEASVKAQHIQGQAGLSDSNNIALVFTYPAPHSYSVDGFATGMQELRNWIDKPVVYKSRVLAIKDEKVQSYSLNADNWDPQTVYPDDPDMTRRRITPVSTLDHFTFDDPELTVTYTAALTCPTTHVGPCTLARLGLAFNTSTANQATLSSFADLDEPATAVSAPYVITITGTAARAGLNPPLVTSAQFQLNVTTRFIPLDTAAPIRFDLINDNSDAGLLPQANLETGANATQPLIDLTTMLTDGRNNAATFSTTQANWQVANCGVTDNSNDVLPNDVCLFRAKNSNNHLEAGDISTTAVQVPINFTVNGITQAASVPVVVTGDSVNNIKGAIATPYTALSSQTINWDTAPVGTIALSYYGASSSPLLSIDNDALGPWQDAAIGMTANGSEPAWTTPLNMNAAGLMTGTAPAVAPTSSSDYAYAGSFNTASRAAAARNVAVGFSANIQRNFVPPTIASKVRFDLINDANDAGLQPQAGVELGAGATQPLIDLSTMAVNGRSANATFSTTQTNWQIANCGVTDAVHNVLPNDSCLFRAKNSNNHLEASDIAGTTVQVPVNVTINDAAQLVNIPVIVTGDSQNDIHGSIADAFTAQSNTAISWNAAAATVASGYYGATPSNTLKLAIDGDSYNAWIANTITPVSESGTPAWSAAPLSVSSSGVITGVAPIVSGANNYLYTSAFAAQSKAATTRTNGVAVTFPITIFADQWINTNGNIKFDMLTTDSNDAINLNSKINPTMTAITAFNLGTSAVGNYNPSNWQVMSDGAGTYYLVRKANNSTVDATEVDNVVQVPISVTGTVNGSVVTSSSTLNVTVNPDANVFYQYNGDGSANSPVSPVIVAAQYPASTAEVPNTHIIFNGTNVKPRVTVTVNSIATTYDVTNDSGTAYHFPAPQRSYISYPDTQTVKFTYALSTDLGDSLSLVTPVDSNSIQANSKAHGTSSWGAMQGLDVQVSALTVTTEAPSISAGNTQCFSESPDLPSSQRSIYYITVPLSSGRAYTLTGINTTASNTNVSRTICPGNPDSGPAYAPGNINTSNSDYACSDGTTYVENDTNKPLPTIRASGDGANELTFFVTQRGLGCGTSGTGLYPRINSPITLSITSAK
jgi:hypothetical protein